MRILCVVQHFRQGWGGAPESIRLLAGILAKRGVSVDVFDLGKLKPRVEALDLLPEPGSLAEDFDLSTVGDYDALMIAGPWQNPRWIRPILKARRPGQPLVYLPRGGLGRIEFARPRDIKKWPYFFLFERRIIDACSALIFSSECEKQNTIAAARHRTREIVIPDFFTAPAPLDRPFGQERREVVFSFMAEISPRKGLVPTVEAFRRLVSDPSLSAPVRLRVGGGVRKGSEAYAGRAREIASAVPPPHSVEFLGAIPHVHRPEFYCDTDVFLVPSLFESFGLTVLEALAAGCATITGPNLGVLEVLPEHDRLGIAGATERHALAEAMMRQYRFALQDVGGARADTAGYCAAAIEALNATATERWIGVLGNQPAEGNLSG